MLDKYTCPYIDYHKLKKFMFHFILNYINYGNEKIAIKHIASKIENAK